MSNYIDFNNDGISGNMADLVYLTSNLSTISNSYSKQYDVNQDNIIDASDVEYLANHIVGNSGYNIPQRGLYIENKENGKLSIGYSNTINGNNSIIIGNNSTVNYNNIAIGNNIIINDSNKMILGKDNSSIVLNGNVKIIGDLSLNGIMHIVDTNVNTNEILSITNSGTGPALIVNQKGIQPILDIQYNSNSCLYIKNGGNVGIGTNEPNNTLDVSGNIRVNGKVSGLFSIGSIIMWSGDYVSQQNNLNLLGWYLCDGNNGVQVNGIIIPDLTNKFVRGSSTVGQLGGSDDAIVVTHTHEVEQQGLHNHIASIQQNTQLHNHSGLQQNTTGQHSHQLNATGSEHYHEIQPLLAPVDDYNYSDGQGGSQQKGLAWRADAAYNIWEQNAGEDYDQWEGATPNHKYEDEISHEKYGSDGFDTRWTESWGGSGSNETRPFITDGSHSHQLQQKSAGSHSHGIQSNGTHSHGATIEENGEHNHIINEFGESGIGANVPSYYTLAFLIYVG